MKKSALLLLVSIVLASCVSGEPKPLQLNSDACDFCKMTISNGQYGAELVTQKGRYYKFDDVACMIHFAASNTVVPYKAFFVCDYLMDNALIPAEKCYFLKGGSINSPMHGNAIAFTTKKEAQDYQTKYKAVLLSWKELYSSY